jgi:hypothetical protein
LAAFLTPEIAVFTSDPESLELDILVFILFTEIIRE